MVNFTQTFKALKLKMAHHFSQTFKDYKNPAILEEIHARVTKASCPSNNHTQN